MITCYISNIILIPAAHFVSIDCESSFLTPVITVKTHEMQTHSASNWNLNEKDSFNGTS